MYRHLLKITHMKIDHEFDFLHLTYYALRFTGVATDEGRVAWQSLKDEFKKIGRAYGGAKWKPYYQWPDGKVGAWIVTDMVLLQYQERFSNLDAMVGQAETAERVRKAHEDGKPKHPWEEDIHSPTYTPAHVSEALKVLGLDTLPSRDTLKITYRRLAKQYHPDKQGNEAIFKKINNANADVLRWIEVQETVTTSWPWRSASA